MSSASKRIEGPNSGYVNPFEAPAVGSGKRSNNGRGRKERVDGFEQQTKTVTLEPLREIFLETDGYNLVYKTRCSIEVKYSARQGEFTILKVIKVANPREALWRDGKKQLRVGSFIKTRLSKEELDQLS